MQSRQCWYGGTLAVTKSYVICIIYEIYVNVLNYTVSCDVGIPPMSYGEQGSMAQILVVDDDPRIRNMLQRYLEGEGYVVQMVSNTKQARLVLKQFTINLVLLDLRLGKDDGLELLREIRAVSKKIGVIILSGKTEVVDKIVGLELGADDYVTKPFHLRELHARIKIVLKRFEFQGDAPNNITNSIVSFGKWKMDLGRQYLEDDDENECKLTTAEFKLLEAFISNPQRVLTREQLLDITTGRHHEPFDRTIDTQVRRLRLKLEDVPNKPSLIKTVRGSGYVLSEKVAKSER